MQGILGRHFKLHEAMDGLNAGFYVYYPDQSDKSDGLFFEILTICIWRGRIITIYIIA